MLSTVLDLRVSSFNLVEFLLTLPRCPLSPLFSSLTVEHCPPSLPLDSIPLFVMIHWFGGNPDLTMKISITDKTRKYLCFY